MISLIELLKQQESPESPPYMYSPVGFGCHVCKFYYVEDEKHMCSNTYYKHYMKTNELIDEEFNEVELNKGSCVEFKFIGDFWYILSSDGLKNS